MCLGCQMSDGAGTVPAPSSPGAPLKPFPTPGDNHRYDGTGAKSPQWWPSRYGADDELGAGNELTDAGTLSALQMPTEGRVIQLAHVLEREVPIWPPKDVKPEVEGARVYHQLVVAHAQLDEMLMGGAEGNGLGYFEELVTQYYHIGTHLDGLGHVGINGRYYNGNHYREFYRPTGLQKYGIHNVKPWVSRGVCLNIADLLGVEMLEEGFVITPEHLEDACKAQNVEIRAGDAVLLHTGYGALWMVDNDRYGNLEPGIGWDAAHWLTDRRISLVGADTWSVEVLPGEQENAVFVVHQHLLAETGTHILENVKTEELAASGRSEFLFILSPVKTKGSTGSMVNPLAIL